MRRVARFLWEKYMQAAAEGRRNDAQMYLQRYSEAIHEAAYQDNEEK